MVKSHRGEFRESQLNWALNLLEFLSAGHPRPETKAEPETLEGAKACSLERKLAGSGGLGFVDSKTFA